jgi:acyl-CoA oxidase
MLSGQFCLTEVGHGLDAVNIETTAVALEAGGFELHTPTLSAAKSVQLQLDNVTDPNFLYRYMPPTVPVGIPTIAVVFARLVVGTEDRGIRPFVVPINDGCEMCSGVTAR